MIASDRRGFAMPAAIFAMAVMTVLAVTALSFSSDEQRSSRALRESGLALTAAEAGGNLILGNTTLIDSLANALSSGDSTDMGWLSLPGGAQYRPVLHRYDAGGQAIYQLDVEGRSSGPAGGNRQVSFLLTKVNPIPITAAIKGGSGGGEADIRDFATLNGTDTIPPAWGPYCNDPLQDKPGLEWGNNDIDDDNGDGIILGSPPVLVDPTLLGTDLFDWGVMDFADLVAMRDIAVPEDDWDGGIAPQLSGGSCDMSDPWNWGAPEDPSHACFDYFPIIHWDGGGNDEFRIRDHNPGEAVGQGILLVDGHLRIEDNFTFYGIILVTGDLRFEAQDGAANHIFGGVIIGGDEARLEDGNKRMQYSQCAVNRAMSGISSLVPLDRRAWAEPLR